MIRLSFLLTCLLVFLAAQPAKSVVAAKHKSEQEIALMTPAQRVDEYVNEYVHHRFDVLDEHRQLIFKYVRNDWVKGTPRIIEIMDEYDPTRFREGKGRRGERFDGCLMLLSMIDGTVVRLRSSDEGRQAIAAIERAVERMRRAGYHDREQAEFQQNSRFTYTSDCLQEKKELNLRDRAIQDTFRLEYKILLSDSELLAFIEFMVARHPEYPGWIETNLIKDPTLKNEAGYPLQRHVLKEPARFHEAYLEFKQPRTT